MDIFVWIKRKNRSAGYTTVHSVEEYVEILRHNPGSQGLGAGAHQANLELSGCHHE